MNKKDSPITRWPGHIIMPSYMSFISLGKWEKAVAQAKALKETDSLAAFYEKLLPVACEVVQEWHIDGLPEHVSADTFPASGPLVGWVIDEISNLFSETNGSDPN